jgi:hypothetical protein
MATKKTCWNSTLSFCIHYIVQLNRLPRRVLLVEQELPTLPEHLGSPPHFCGIRVTRSLVLFVCFVDRCLLNSDILHQHGGRGYILLSSKIYNTLQYVTKKYICGILHLWIHTMKIHRGQSKIDNPEKRLNVLSSVVWCPLRFPHENGVRFVFTSSCL